MSETKQLRLGQVARKLNVGRNTIINFLHEKGYEAVSYTHLTLPTKA